LANRASINFSGFAGLAAPRATLPTLDQLNILGLYGMVKAFGALSANDEAQGLSHAEWLGLILDYEAT
jgi:hypothetical protein